MKTPLKCYIGFDFSISKPAVCIIYEDKQGNETYDFLFFPANCTKKDEELYRSLDVVIHNRNLKDEHFHKSSANISEITLQHTKRSKRLAELMVETIFTSYVDFPIDDVYIATEGLSFSSKGQAMLDLAQYKGVLLEKIYERLCYNDERLITFSPSTIKSFAGCSKKGESSSKNAMIQAFKNTYPNTNHKFAQTLINDEKVLLKKVNYVAGVDDLVDAFFVAKKLQDSINNIKDA